MLLIFDLLKTFLFTVSKSQALSLSTFSLSSSSQFFPRTTSWLLASSINYDDSSATTSSSFVVDSYEPRAGEDGFSIIRKPMSLANWDPDAPVDFNNVAFNSEAKESSPSCLLERDNAEWWSSRTSPGLKPIGIASTQTRNMINDQSNNDLDLFQRSLDTLDYPKILQSLVLECTTSTAKKLVQRAMRVNSSPRSTFLSRALQSMEAVTVEGARGRYQAVHELELIMRGEREDVTYRDARGYSQLVGSPPIGGCSCNLEPLFGEETDEEEIDQQERTTDSMYTASESVPRILDADDIDQVCDLLDTMQTVINWASSLRKVDGIEFVELPKLADCIVLNATLKEFLNEAVEGKNGNGRDQQRLSDSAFPVLGQLRSRVQALRGKVLATLDGIVALPSTQKKLALDSGGSLYSEVSGRLVIPVHSKFASIGIVHDISRSGKTVYVEPTEIVGLTNELRQAEGELRAEEIRIWRLITNEVNHNQRDLVTSSFALGQLDLVHAKYQLGRKLHGVIPIVQNEGVISVQNGKHPVLLLRNIPVVGSTVELGANGNQGLVLTGPNSGGKTIILKLLGLFAHMSRAGIPIPADTQSPRVDFFDPILADIGDIQSVGGDLSTFSGHMLVCREVLRHCKRNSLVLMDELGSGTDPNQGVALAQAILEEMIDTGCRVAITTHFLQLKQLAASDDRFSVAGMQFVDGRPTYKLQPGIVGGSFALAVAERLELPKRVTKRAAELMDSETRQMGDIIRDLEDQKALVDKQLIAIDLKTQEMSALEMKLQDEMVRMERRQLQTRREDAKKFARKLEEKEKVLENILEKIKLDPSRRVLAKSWEEIKLVKRDALNEAEQVPSVIAQRRANEAVMDQMQSELIPISELAEFPTLLPGDTIIVCRKGPLLGRQGTIVKNLGNRVETSVNNVNVGFKLSEIALPNKLLRSKNVKKISDSSSRQSISKTARRDRNEISLHPAVTSTPSTSSSTATTDNRGVTLRTESNTVDVRGCNLEEAKALATAAFSRCLMMGRSVVYILHGHGTGGVLKAKIRGWLGSERSLVKRFCPADRSEGGDAFTRVELK